MSGKDDYLATGFRDVDGANTAKMMRCLDVLQSMECFQRYKDRSLELLCGANGASALDVGCGLGDDVAKLKGKFGRAVGIDSSSELIGEAIRRHRTEGCEFQCADASFLPFRDEEFDAARVDRALQHLDGPNQAIREMARVIKKGGMMLCAEPDWGTFFIGTAPSPETRSIQERWTASFKNPWIGRNLFAMMNAAGIAHPSVEAHLLLTKGFEASDFVFDITKSVQQLNAEGRDEARLQSWLNEYKKSEALAGVVLFICYGAKE